jgi:hypothetical protein
MRSADPALCSLIWSGDILHHHHNSPSDKARNTASVRVLAVSFKKMRLTCDFTVSGEISRARAMCLLEKPWLIIAITSYSRAVSVSVTRLLGCAEGQLASRASHQESGLPTNGTSRSLDRGTSVPGIKVTSFGAGLIDLFLSVQTKVRRAPAATILSSSSTTDLMPRGARACTAAAVVLTVLAGLGSPTRPD